MIDFRYHVISIVAVLLALSIGIVTGSAFLGGPLLEQLENRVDALEAQNTDLLGRVRNAERDAAHRETALAAFESALTEGVLSGRRVVVWRIAETSAGAVDAAEASVEEADAEVTSTVDVSALFALDDLAAREELTSAMGLPDETAADLRLEIAELLGSRAGAIATQGEIEGAFAGDGPQNRFDDVLDPLREAGYLEVEVREEGSPVVAPASALVIVAGSEGDPPFEVAPFVVRLASSFAARGNAVVVVEAEDSSWNVVDAVRADDEARERVSTVDEVDTATGRISLAVALDRAAERPAGHYGAGEGADAPVPPLSQGG